MDQSYEGRGALIFAFLVVSSSLVSQDATVARFGVDIERVVMSVGVLGRDGLPVSGLGVEDFVVRDDGVEQRVTSVAPADDVPLTVALVLDVSGSVSEYAEDIVQSANSFLDSLQPQDCVGVMHFDALVRPAKWGSPADPGLRQALRFEGPEYPGSAFYDSVMAALVSVEPDSPAAWSTMATSGMVAADGSTTRVAGFAPSCRPQRGLAARTAVVIVTDALDAGSEFTYSAALSAAWETNVPVFILGIGAVTRPYGRYNRLMRSDIFISPNFPVFRVLDEVRELTSTSGGKFLKAGSPRLVRSAFEEIALRLRASYLVTFEPTSDTDTRGTWRDVDVDLRPRELRSFHAPRYFRARTYPAAARSALRAGLEEFEDGNLDEAILSFQQASWADPNLAAAYYHEARAFARQHRAVDALTAFRRAWDREPGVGDREIAKLLIETDDPDAAWPYAIQATIAGTDSDLVERLQLRSRPPGDVSARLAAPRVLVPARKFVDPEWRGTVDELTRALRVVVWHDPAFGLVRDASRAAYATKLFFDEPPGSRRHDLKVHLEFYNRDGIRVFRRKLTVADVDDPLGLQQVFRTALTEIEFRR